MNGLVAEAGIVTAHLLRRSTDRTLEEVADLVLQDPVGRATGQSEAPYFRGDAAFANPEVYEFFEAEGMSYTIRLPRHDRL
jgi:hypothetical protein